MSRELHPPLPRHALLSNAGDAAGNQIYDTAMTIIVITVLGFGASQVGLLNALSTLSFLLLAVSLGIAVDALGAARVLVVSLSVKTLLMVLTLCLYGTGLLGTVSAMIIVTLMGVATVASENAQTTVVPQLVTSGRETAQLVARMASADRIAGVVAPGGTGALLVLTGAGLPLALSGALMVLALLPAARLLSLPRVQEPPSHETSGSRDDSARSGRRGSSLGHGFVLLLRNRLLLATTLLVATGNMGLAIGDSVEGILVLRVLDLGTVFYGALGTVAALAGLLASVVAPRIVLALPVRKVFVLGALLQTTAASLPLMALLYPAGGYVLLIAFHVLWAVTLTITNIAGAAYAARAVEATSLGRASAARRTITMGCVPVAALGGGILADLAGIVAPLIVWPALTLAATAVFLVLTSATTGEDTEPPSESDR